MIEQSPGVGGSAFGVLASVTVVVLCSLLAFGRGKVAASTIFVGLLLIPLGNRVDVLGINFNSARILLTVGLAAVVARRDTRPKSLSLADVSIAAYPFALTVVWAVREGIGSGLAGGFGYGFDLAFAYFIARGAIRNLEDVRRLGFAVSLVAVLVMGLGLVEFATRANPFSLMGGVLTETMVRNGWTRVQGAWVHPILYGVGWASLVPLCLSARGSVLGIRTSVLGAGCAAGVVFLSGSSSSLSVLVAVVGLLPFWRVTRYRNTLFLSALVVLGALHFLMSGPVWSLIAKVNLFSGSTGWHRFAIVDNAITRFDEWGVGGLVSTAHWGPGLWDVTNTFVLVGVRGGAVSLVLFVLPIVAAVWGVWGLVAQVTAIGDRKVIWFVGVAVQASAIAFLSVGYVGQALPLFGLLLGAANALIVFGDRLRGSGAERSGDIKTWAIRDLGCSATAQERRAH